MVIGEQYAAEHLRSPYNGPGDGLVTWRESAFEQQFLGGSSWRLSVRADAGRADIAEALAAVRVEAAEAGVALLSCRIAADFAAAAAALEETRFRRVERLLTFRRNILPLPTVPWPIDDFRPEDHAICIDIARTAFSYDRFHADPLIDNHGADALKAAWVANGIKGRASRTLVVHDEERTSGFVLCLEHGGEAVIDLIAVAQNARKRGLGSALVAGALAAFDGTATTMRAGTQTTNIGSIGLYLRMGFKVAEEAFTYHFLPAREAL